MHIRARVIRRYREKGMLADNRKLLILRTAVGGSGFLDNHWKIGDDFYTRMLDMTGTALSLHPENCLVGFLWHQRETDAVLQASYETHYGNLMCLVQAVRKEFAVPILPFIAGDFVYQWKGENADICRPVIDAIRAVCRDCGNAGFVETDGLLSNLQEMGRHTQCGFADHFWDNTYPPINGFYELQNYAQIATSSRSLHSTVRTESGFISAVK